MAHGDHLKYSGKPKAGKKTFLRLVSYVACDRRLLIVIGVLIVVSIAANLTGSYMLRPIINNYILPGDFHGLVRILRTGRHLPDRGSGYLHRIYSAE